MNERAHKYGPGNRLVGIHCAPSVENDQRAVVVIPNAGLLHRVGPNRLHVQLARALAQGEHPSFRFDARGLGDSPPGDTETDMVEEIERAVDHLSRSLEYRRFILMGICTGGVAAFTYALQDPRVVGVALLNPLGGDLVETLAPEARDSARWRHYVQSSLHNREAWQRLLTGKVDYRPLVRTVAQQISRLLISEAVPAPRLDDLGQNLNRLLERGTRVLVVHTEWGEESDLIRMLKLPASLQEGALTANLLVNCDHTFTPLRCQRALLDIARNWVSADSGAMPVLADKRWD